MKTTFLRLMAPHGYTWEEFRSHDKGYIIVTHWEAYVCRETEKKWTKRMSKEVALAHYRKRIHQDKWRVSKRM